MYRHLLVLVDDRDASIAAIGHATEFARSIGARITFACVESDEDLPPERCEALLARAEAAARAQGVPASALPVERGGMAIRHSEAALRHGCDLVCVAPGSLFPDAPGVAVLTCPSHETPVAEAAIGALLAAHRALTDALDELLALARAALVCRREPDGERLRAVIHRIEALFAERARNGLADWLAAKLRERTSAFDAELDEQARLHLKEKALLARLAGTVHENEPILATSEQLEQAVMTCVQLAWERMGRIEGVVLPAARRHLRDTDWRALAASHEVGAT